MLRKIWQDKDKCNIPNALTAFRIFPLAPAVMLFLITQHTYWAVFFFVIAVFTDLLDGYLARKWGQVTITGELLDPIADKVIIICPLIILINYGVSPWIVIVIFLREILIAFGRFLLDGNKKLRGSINVSTMGKIKMWVQSLCLVYAMLQLPFFNEIMIIAAIFTICSGVDYFVKLIIVLRKQKISQASS